MGCGSSVTVDEAPERSRVESLESPRKRHLQAPLPSTPSPRATAAADKATRHWLVRSLPRFHYIPKVSQPQERTIQDNSFSSAEGDGTSDREQAMERSLIVESQESTPWGRDRSANAFPSSDTMPPTLVPSTMDYITGISSFQEQPPRCESPLLNRNGATPRDCDHSMEGQGQGQEVEEDGGVACNDCMVCLNPLPDHRLVTLPCFHTFHEECVLDWLTEKGLCPTCRTPLTPAALTWSYEFQEELLQQYD